MREICEWRRFRSPLRETLLWGRLVQNEGGSPKWQLWGNLMTNLYNSGCSLLIFSLFSYFPQSFGLVHKLIFVLCVDFTEHSERDDHERKNNCRTNRNEINLKFLFASISFNFSSSDMCKSIFGKWKVYFISSCSAFYVQCHINNTYFGAVS